ncbi:MAG TPA: LysM peptidoglycan-binding domain-containing protein [Candidatus Avidehalobacter gallistercoris]|uniref:LysM peptidoglycan-binding domain-containing protein n=1 Tax=Candidatus Avidehalobacter gallistercoris TaxID=2840694 RepID=A0A9D1HIC0_9FIRM|nr:LysM peptidoglycan-binding domain-containing protein [Candidatus Avidehalobacter gallistercoris]
MNYHIIQPGDSLWSIAQNHGCSLQEVLAANPQISNPNNITVGDRVILPEGCAREQQQPQNTGFAGIPQVEVEPNIGLPDMDETSRSEICSELRRLPRPLIYVVKQNDNIYQLAKCFDISMKELLQVNPQIQNPDMIYPGDKIFVPRARTGLNMNSLNECGSRFCPTCGSKLS